MQRITSEIMRVLHTVGPKTWKQIAIGFVAFVLPLILFIGIADEVLEKETIPVDVAILQKAYSLSNPTLDAFVVATTDLGYIWFVGCMALIILFVCIKRHAYSSALIAAVSLAGSALINIILKILFQRDRPALWERLVTENSYSFPSGHAMASASLAGVIIVLLWPTKWRYPAIVGAVLYMVYIAFTRLYLGVHYPTDIVAGWLVTGMWVTITTVIITKLRRTA
jgi:undecaprenyl-diphosphatase